MEPLDVYTAGAQEGYAEGIRQGQHELRWLIDDANLAIYLIDKGEMTSTAREAYESSINGMRCAIDNLERLIDGR